MAITKWTKYGPFPTLNPEDELKRLFDTVERLPSEYFGGDEADSHSECFVFRVQGDGVPQDDVEIFTLFENMNDQINRGRLGYYILDKNGLVSLDDINHDPIVVWEKTSQ